MQPHVLLHLQVKLLNAIKGKVFSLHHRSMRKLHTVRHMSLVLGCYSTYLLGDSAWHSMIVTVELMVCLQHLRRVRQGRYLSIALHIPSASSITTGMGVLDLLRDGTTLTCFMSSSWTFFHELGIRNATGTIGDEVSAVCWNSSDEREKSTWIVVSYDNSYGEESKDCIKLSSSCATLCNPQINTKSGCDFCNKSIEVIIMQPHVNYTEHHEWDETFDSPWIAC